MRVTDTHVYFWHEFLSQWNTNKDGSPQFYENKIGFKSAEHYMMFNKAIIMNDLETAQLILESKTPRDAKALGRLVKNFNKELWDAECERVVYQGNLLKFTQNSNLLEKLLAFQDKILVEASPEDPIWGVALDENDPLILDESTWKGENRLGKVLTQLTQQLKGLKCYQ